MCDVSPKTAATGLSYQGMSLSTHMKPSFKWSFKWVQTIFCKFKTLIFNPKEPERGFCQVHRTMIMFVYSILSALDLQTSRSLYNWQLHTLTQKRRGAALQFLRFICCLFDQQTNNDDGWYGLFRSFTNPSAAATWIQGDRWFQK